MVKKNDEPTHFVADVGAAAAIGKYFLLGILATFGSIGLAWEAIRSGPGSDNFALVSERQAQNRQRIENLENRIYQCEADMRQTNWLIQQYHSPGRAETRWDRAADNSGDTGG